MITDHFAIGGESAWMPFGKLEIVTAYSEANLDLSVSEEFSTFSAHLYGNNDAMLFGATPDIDVHAVVSTSWTGHEDGSGIFEIKGSITGDRFPAFENVLADGKGNSIFLGISGASGGPFTSLPGDFQRDMVKYHYKIKFGSDGSMQSVNFNGQTYSVDDWNMKFNSMNPQKPGSMPGSSSRNID